MAEQGEFEHCGSTLMCWADRGQRGHRCRQGGLFEPLLGTKPVTPVTIYFSPACPIKSETHHMVQYVDIFQYLIDLVCSFFFLTFFYTKVMRLHY